MNQHNAELIRRHFALEEQNDTEAVLQDMVDDPVYIVPGMYEAERDSRSDVRKVHRGKDAIRAIHEALFDAFEDLRIDVKTLIADDDAGCAEIDVNGVLAGPFDSIEHPGARVHIQHVAIFTFRDGKIASESVYYDRRELMHQLDLREEVVAGEAQASRR